jgi:hypothetical protein
LYGWFRPSAIIPWELPWGLPRFLLTPLPWRLAETNEFQFLPSVLHLFFILPALAVVPLLWARGGAARLMLVHGALVVLLYAVVPDLQGSRQRYQIAHLFAWAQFHALWTLARWASGQVAARSGGVKNPKVV